jgi:hypothetical protein
MFWGWGGRAERCLWRGGNDGPKGGRGAVSLLCMGDLRRKRGGRVEGEGGFEGHGPGGIAPEKEP